MSVLVRRFVDLFSLSYSVLDCLRPLAFNWTSSCCSGLKDIYGGGKEEGKDFPLKNFQSNLAWLSGRGKYAQLLERDHNLGFGARLRAFRY